VLFFRYSSFFARMSKLSHEEETAGLSRLKYTGLCWSLKNSKVISFYFSWWTKFTSLCERSTLRLGNWGVTVFLRISSKTLRWQQTTFSWFASNMGFIWSVKQRINWYYQICQLQHLKLIRPKIRYYAKFAACCLIHSFDSDFMKHLMMTSWDR